MKGTERFTLYDNNGNVIFMRQNDVTLDDKDLTVAEDGFTRLRAAMTGDHRSDAFRYAMERYGEAPLPVDGRDG